MCGVPCVCVRVTARTVLYVRAPHGYEPPPPLSLGFPVTRLSSPVSRNPTQFALGPHLDVEHAGAIHFGPNRLGLVEF